jgi:hypothetical protein
MLMIFFLLKAGGEDIRDIVNIDIALLEKYGFSEIDIK